MTALRQPVSMAAGSGKLLEQRGEQADLCGIRDAGNRAAGEPDLKCGGLGGRCQLGNEEGRTGHCGTRLPATPAGRDPRGQRRILDAALAGEVRAAQAAGLIGGENLPLELVGIADAAAAVGLDDDAGGWIGVGLHRPPSYAQRPDAG